MPLFLDTSGRTTLGIAVCARCGIKMSREELFDDPNYPGLKVCRDDLDVLDPWRLAPRATEDITMEWVRPDVAIDGYGSTPVYVKPIQAVIGVGPRPLPLGLLNDGGVLYLDPSSPFTALYPTSSLGLPKASVYSLGGAIGVVPPVTPNPAAYSLVFGYISALQLLLFGAGNIPVTGPAPGSLIIWNNGGLLCAA